MDQNSKHEINSSKISIDEMVERIYAAVLEQKLPPSTKLSESTLCESFGVGRMKVRQVLTLLSSQGIVDIKANRGAFIACPDSRESKEVFGARLALEPGMLHQAVLVAKKEDFELLKEIIQQENQARITGERRELIRLSGEFHVQLAALTGNRVIERMLRELVARTSLIVGMFGSSGDHNCPEDEHQKILTALIEKKPDAAADLVYQHLEHIEASLNLSSRMDKPFDVLSVLRG